ncbi:MAG: hypothetical protein DLM53_07075 [Candidatus Eremiobacter antarcticus]|nr:TolC family protein [Candidatus Eremiobacteraeota bacterium]MBC5808747.1 TolC family protein [Candidatus Eremiobacteraeota bacterium]PZR62220.1 MAG: hypothetical protein DLM53_07075 [Candidatus Eremiobacter sp. RRmetagenome_bin22]
MRVPLFVAIVVALLPAVGLADNAPLTLESALAEGLSRSPAVLAAQKDFEAQEARLRAATFQPLGVAIDRDAQPDTPGSPGGTISSSTVGLSQTFPAVGKVRAQRSSQAAFLRAAHAAVDAARREVALDIVGAFYNLALVQSEVSTAAQSVALNKELLRVARLRNKAGAVGSFEVVRANLELRRAQFNEQGASGRRRAAQIRLSTLLVLPSSQVVVPPLNPSVRPLPAELDAAMNLADPDARQFQAQAEAAHASAAAAAAERLPSFQLKAGTRSSRAEATGLSAVGPATTLSLEIPLIDFGTIKGAIREARATSEAQSARQAARRLTVTGIAAELQSDFTTAQARSDFANESEREARQALTIAQIGYKAGALGLTDIINAQNALVAAQADVRAAEFDLGLASAKAEVLTGRLPL